MSNTVNICLVTESHLSEIISSFPEVSRWSVDHSGCIVVYIRDGTADSDHHRLVSRVSFRSPFVVWTRGLKTVIMILLKYFVSPICL